MIAVVPTRDEAETIGQTVLDLKRCGSHVRVVDSSENMATFHVAVAAGAEAVECARDGLGPAYALGWEGVNWGEWIIHADAGGSHPYESLRAVAAATEWNDYDVIVGSRFLKDSLYVGNPRRRRMSKLAAVMCSLVSRYEFTDWTSGLRAYSPRARSALAAHKFTTKGHAWQIEALDVLSRKGMKIREVPITYVAGRSHLTRARIREAARYWWRMWTS